MSINQLYEISRRSFRTIDASMNVVGQNVANADNENYARQRLVQGSESLGSQGLYTRPFLKTATGMGVGVQSYERLRDSMLGAAARDAQTTLDGANEEARMASALEAVFPTGDASMTSLLDDFWSAWNDVAANPTDAGARQSVLSRAESFAQTLHRMDGDVRALRDETDLQLDGGIESLNGMLDELGALNETISTAAIGGSPDYAAQDARDQLLTRIAGFGPVKVQPDDTGAFNVTMNGIALVQGNDVNHLKLDRSGAVPQVKLDVDADVPIRLDGNEDGKLGAWISTLTTTIPETLSSLDALAAGLVGAVNAAHTTGYGLDGATGRTFFDPAGTTASTIAVSADVAGNPDALAASSDGTAGDNRGAFDIAALQTAGIVGGETASDAATAMVTKIGTTVRAAQSKAMAQEAVVGQLTGMERAVSGVSLEEEMTHMIELQQSYAASARVLSTAQQMMDTLLSL